MVYYRKFILLIILVTLLHGCTLAGMTGIQASNPQSIENRSSAYPIPQDATPTPTPFQPLSPTAIYTITGTPLPTATEIPPTPTLPTVLERAAVSPELLQQSGQINILLLGSDQRPWDSMFRTDTIVLATINNDLGTVNLTSFPRDLYVSIPNYGQERINTAFQTGGFDLLAKTFGQNFGVTPDYYVLINFSSFKRLVDNLGGLDVQVSKPLSDYRDGYYVTIPTGKIHMDADTVLWYVRSRKTTNDFYRTHRQQDVLQALFDQLLSLDAIKRFPEFYAFYKDAVTTDLGFTDLLTLIPIAIKVADDRSRIHQYYIGPQQVYDWMTPAGAMVLVPVPEAVQKVIHKSQNLP